MARHHDVVGHCPYCDAPHDTQSNLQGEEGAPEGGQAIFLCIACACPGFFDGDGIVRRLTVDEMRAVIFNRDVMAAVLSIIGATRAIGTHDDTPLLRYVPKMVTCPECKGSGDEDAGSYYEPMSLPCSRCGGQGEIPV